MQDLRRSRPGRRRAIARAIPGLAASIAVVAALAASGAPAWAAASDPGPIGTAPVPVPGRTTAALSVCHVAADLTDRYATFAAEMVATPGTAEMSLRLALYEHTPGTAGYHLVSGVPGFGVWEDSAPGIGVFSYSQEVTSLTAPASFRVQVGYRWMDSDHHVTRRASRTTASCAEPAQLANLVAGAVSIEPGVVAGTSTYAVTVRNDGVVPAGRFAVELEIDGVALPEQTVVALDPGARTDVDFAGSACAPGGTLEIVVDPANAVSETTKVDDSRTVACT
jgi:hypothetical protein